MGMLLTRAVVLAGVKREIAGAAGKIGVASPISVASWEVPRKDLT